MSERFLLHLLSVMGVFGERSLAPYVSYLTTFKPIVFVFILWHTGPEK